MKKAAKIANWFLACVALAALFVIVSGIVWWVRQPRYAGKLVHQWFAEGIAQFSGPHDPAKWEQVQLAFQKMGPDAVPFLLNQFSWPDRPQIGLRDRWILRVRQSRLIPARLKSFLPQPFFNGSQEWIAGQLLQALGPAAISAQPALEQILVHTNISNKHMALELLSTFGLKASNSAPIVATLFSGTNESFRYNALWAFGKITPPRSAHAAALLRAIERGDIRAADGLRVLASLKVDYTPVLPRLGDELCATNGMYNSSARAACLAHRLHKQVLIPRFAEAMNVPDPRFRAELLQDIRPLAREAAPTLDAVIAALNDPYYYVRAEAAKTLAAWDPEGDARRKAIEALRARNTDDNDYVRETIQAALNTLGQDRPAPAAPIAGQPAPYTFE